MLRSHTWGGGRAGLSPVASALISASERQSQRGEVMEVAVREGRQWESERGGSCRKVLEALPLPRRHCQRQRTLGVLSTEPRPFLVRAAPGRPGSLAWHFGHQPCPVPGHSSRAAGASWKSAGLRSLPSPPECSRGRVTTKTKSQRLGGIWQCGQSSTTQHPQRAFSTPKKAGESLQRSFQGRASRNSRPNR